MVNKLTSGAFAAFATMLLAAPDASAAIITSFSLPSGPNIPVSTPAPNNDNTVIGSPNVIDPPAAPGTAVVFNTPNSIDMSFGYQQSGGTTEYFLRETILNNTGVEWSGYTMRLQSPFVGTGTLILPDFDSPAFDPSPTASRFAALATSGNQLTWSGGTVPTGGLLSLAFSVDVPDLNISPLPSNVTFTLDQTPIAVPEPLPFLLFSAGAGVLATWRPDVQTRNTLSTTA